MAGRDLTPLISTGPGALGAARLRRARPNPRGGLDALWLIEADATQGPPRGLVAGDPADIPRETPPARRLRLFHVNDMHNHLAALPDGPSPIAEVAARVAAARAGAGPDEAVLFLSAGDDHTGTIFDELLGWSEADFTLDPGYRALSAAGCDAAALGNHEFDRGSAQLVRGIAADAAFPVLSANVHASAHLVPGRHYHAAALAEAKGLRIGIIGLTTRVETRVGQPSDPGLAVASPVDVLANLLPLVSRISDVVVILSHCGYGDGTHASGKAPVARDVGEADFALAATAARLTDRPCVIVGAHTHTRLNEDGLAPENLRHGILVAQAECNGRFLGEIVVAPGAGTPPEARLIALGDGPEDAAFREATLAPMVARVAAKRAEAIGTAGPGLAWADTRAARYRGECALANAMNDALVAAMADLPEGRPDLSLLNSASVLAGVGPGPVTFGQWFDVMPYADEVFLVTATGAEIAAILQSNAQRILRPEEAVDEDGFIARGFLHASAGLRYRIRLGETAAAARAEGITLFGRPVEERWNARFTLAMTTYLALGSFGERWNGLPVAGGVPGDLPGLDLRKLPSVNTGLVYRDLLVGQIRASGGIAGACDGRLEVV